MSKQKCYIHQPSNGWKQNDEEQRLQKVTSHLIQKLANRTQVDESARAKIQQIWSLYSSLPIHLKPITLDGIMHHSCISQLSYLSTTLRTLAKVNFLAILPKEICFKILNHLDATSLCRAAQVCSSWKSHADNDIVWKRMCSQHIDKRCDTCGWGLPLMTAKRQLSADAATPDPKRSRIEPNQSTTLPIRSAEQTKALQIEPLEPISGPAKPTPVVRSWKQIFAERSVVARNWRKPSFKSKNLIGHTDGVMGLYFDDSRSLLLSASEDHTLRAWNTDTGVCLGILKGHTDSVRSVQFDASKIISCSMDKTIRIWNLKTYECVRVIEGKIANNSGHTAGIISIHFIDRFLASGAQDGIIRVWNLEAGTSFTLVGHRDWANKVKILSNKTQLLSCSDDGTIILWDIFKKSPIRKFLGHQGPVQTLTLLKPLHAHGQENIHRMVSGSLDHTIKVWDLNTGQVLSTLFGHTNEVWGVDADSIRIVSASHDKTLKIWDLHSGKCVHTFTSHHAAVNAVWLSDTKLISSDAEGVITVRDFLS